MNATDTLTSLSDVIITSMTSLNSSLVTMTSLNSSLVTNNQTESVEPQEEDPNAYYYSDIFWEKVSFYLKFC